MTTKAFRNILAAGALVGLLAGAISAQTTNTTTTDTTTTPAKPTTTLTTDGTNSTGPFVSGKVYTVTSAQKTILFAGKEIVLPQGIQFQVQDGYLIVSLPPDADRNVAVVRLGKTYLVVTKKEQLILDPTGIPRNLHRIQRHRIRPIRRGRIIRAVDEAPEASPVRP